MKEYIPKEINIYINIYNFCYSFRVWSLIVLLIYELKNRNTVDLCYVMVVDMPHV